MPISFGFGKGQFSLKKQSPPAVVSPVTDQLIVYYDPGNASSYSGSGTTVIDLSTGGNNGTLYSVDYSSSYGGTFVNDTKYDRIDCGLNTQMSQTAYTKCIWARFTAYQENNFISGGDLAQHAMWMGNGNVLYAGHNGGWFATAGATTLATDTWYFLCVSFSTTGGFKLYVNGNLDASNPDNTATFNQTGNGELRITSFTGNGFGMSGNIGPALVYNKVLSASEITQNFNAFKSRYGY